MNSIKLCVKMHKAQYRVPHRSQCFQQLYAIVAMPFTAEGHVTVSLVVSICYLLVVKVLW